VTPAYLTHFGLREAPFHKDLDDRALWLPPSKLAVSEALEEALAEHASVSLVGEPGVGKTCLLRALRARLPERGYRLTYCHNATLGRRDFYRQLCTALGLAPSATAAALFHAGSADVQALGSESRQHPVFLLDEAHLLHQDTLAHLHILLNYEWDRRPLLSVVLVGLPELADRLSLRINRSLYSRLHHRLRIDPLTGEDSAAYLRLRLERVGCERGLFADDAIVALHEAAHGAHRELDRLATDALRAAARKGKRVVDRAVARQVVASDASREEGDR
jgi:general secretion pathway protein A